MNIAILGTPVDVGNRGVTALSTSLVNLCIERVNGGAVFIMVGHSKPEKVRFRLKDRDKEIEVVNYRLSPKARVKEHLVWILIACLLYRFLPFSFIRKALSHYTPWIAALEKAYIVGDVRGGDSFSDIYGIKRFLEGFFTAWTVLLVKGNLVQFPQTFGPYKNKISKILAKYLFSRSSMIMVRDKESEKVARDFAGNSVPVKLCPDVAFSLLPIRPETIKVNPPIRYSNIPESPLGININGLVYNGGYTRNNMFGLKLDYRRLLPDLIEKLLLIHPGEIWLIPHTYGPPESVESDPEACRKVRSLISDKYKERVRIINKEYDCHELKWIIGQCDFFIGSRMHSCIAALSQGVPCVGIAYSQKFEGVFDTVGMADWVIDGRKVGNEEAIARAIELYQKRNEIRETIKQNAAQAKKILEETFDRLFQEYKIS